MVWDASVTKRRKGLQANQKRTRRARLKGWRLGAPNHLSAHLFLGALCKTLWRTGLLKPVAVIGFLRAPAGLRPHGGR